MKNDLFPFWAEGWKAFQVEQQKKRKVVLPTTFLGRLLRIGRAIFTPSASPIDKRLF